MTLFEVHALVCLATRLTSKYETRNGVLALSYARREHIQFAHAHTHTHLQVVVPHVRRIHIQCTHTHTHLHAVMLHARRIHIQCTHAPSQFGNSCMFFPSQCVCFEPWAGEKKSCQGSSLSRRTSCVQSQSRRHRHAEALAQAELYRHVSMPMLVLVKPTLKLHSAGHLRHQHRQFAHNIMLRHGHWYFQLQLWQNLAMMRAPSLSDTTTAQKGATSRSSVSPQRQWRGNCRPLFEAGLFH